MKSLRLTVLASTLLAAACSPGADSVAQPSPPEAAPSAPAALPATTNDRASLDALLREHAGYADDPGPRSVVARTVEGGPAHPRITLAYLTDRDFCGSGGCTLLIAEPTVEGWALLGRVTVARPPMRVLTTQTNGMPDLAVTVCGGGVTACYEAILPFDGNRYASNPTVAPAHPLETTTASDVIISEELVRLTLAGGQ